MSNTIDNNIKGKAYWRSLDHLAETPEFKELVQKEFPEGADELSSPVSRRKFLNQKKLLQENLNTTQPICLLV